MHFTCISGIFCFGFACSRWNICRVSKRKNCDAVKFPVCIHIVWFTKNSLLVFSRKFFFFFYLVVRETSLLLPPTAKLTVLHFLLRVSETRDVWGIRLTARDHVTYLLVSSMCDSWISIALHRFHLAAWFFHTNIWPCDHMVTNDSTYNYLQLKKGKDEIVPVHN
jgi:hypothetical protein